VAGAEQGYVTDVEVFSLGVACVSMPIRCDGVPMAS
jgi:DNA-binding IclR family transcriptional regulator